MIMEVDGPGPGPFNDEILWCHPLRLVRPECISPFESFQTVINMNLFCDTN